MFERVEPEYILAAVRVSDGYDYVLNDFASEFFTNKLKLKSLGAARTPEYAGVPSDSRVRTDHIDLNTNETVNDIVTEAVAEDDPREQEPKTKVSFVASAPLALFGEEPIEDHMFNDKANRF